MAAIGQVGREEEDAVMREFAAAGGFGLTTAARSSRRRLRFSHGLDAQELC